MGPSERQRCLSALLGMRRRAAYLATRLSARPRSAPLVHGLVARARALDNLFERDARWQVESTRLSAEFGAIMERLSEATSQRVGASQLQRLEAQVHQLAITDGSLRAERTQLDARFLAEHQAFVTTERLLQIRLSGLT